MSSKTCAGCSKAILNRERLQCFKCTQWYDLDCASIVVRLFRQMSSEGRNTWECIDCNNKKLKVNNSINTPEQFGAIRKTSLLKTSIKKSAAVTKKSTAAAVVLTNKINPVADKSPCKKPSSNQISDHEEEEDSPITRKTLRDIIAQEIGSSLKTLSNDQSQLRDLFDGFNQAINFFSEKYEELKVAADEKSEKIKLLEAENSFLQESVRNLTRRMNITEQYARSSNVELQCVPENKSENLIKTVLQLGKNIKCDIEDADISHCTRIAKKNTESDRPRSILVKFNSPRLRDSFLASAIQYNRNNPKERLSTSHLGAVVNRNQPAHPIYVAEHLSADNKILHSAARARARELDYKFVWVRNGRIFIKRSEESERITVDNLDQLNHLH